MHKPSLTKTSGNSYIYASLMIFIIIFCIIFLLGKFGPRLEDNNHCYAYIGCDVGFFGYDGVEHTLSGIIDVLFILWISQKRPHLSLFHQDAWKNILITISIVAFIAVGWEIGEFINDEARILILNENLYTTNHLDQPNNIDTMGDISLTLIGSIITLSIIRPKMAVEQS